MRRAPLLVTGRREPTKVMKRLSLLEDNAQYLITVLAHANSTNQTLGCMGFPCKLMSPTTKSMLFLLSIDSWYRPLVLDPSEDPRRSRVDIGAAMVIIFAPAELVTAAWN